MHVVHEPLHSLSSLFHSKYRPCDAAGRPALNTHTLVFCSQCRANGGDAGFPGIMTFSASFCSLKAVPPLPLSFQPDLSSAQSQTREPTLSLVRWTWRQHVGGLRQHGISAPPGHMPAFTSEFPTLSSTQPRFLPAPDHQGGPCGCCSDPRPSSSPVHSPSVQSNADCTVFPRMTAPVLIPSVTPPPPTPSSPSLPATLTSLRTPSQTLLKGV